MSLINWNVPFPQISICIHWKGKLISIRPSGNDPPAHTNGKEIIPVLPVSHLKVTLGAESVLNQLFSVPRVPASTREDFQLSRLQGCEISTISIGSGISGEARTPCNNRPN